MRNLFSGTDTHPNYVCLVDKSEEDSGISVRLLRGVRGRFLGCLFYIALDVIRALGEKDSFSDGARSLIVLEILSFHGIKCVGRF